ncbi:hypothetical protein IFM89_008214 [Coptis chinensis]|uniref:Uncharacterized protein n=1 Tax=Coptis chinensis TaxID=261450 RepID=A0A835GV87_9MAGN|nr:hypothetical protein IFM89_008214 [Coptis chinensis]
MSLLRFKLWWMTQRMGMYGKDHPLETQFMLVESKDDSSEEDSTIYTVFLTLLEGQFRAVLQGNNKNEVEICLESDLEFGGVNSNATIFVETNQGLHTVYMHALAPILLKSLTRGVEKHMKTFHHREKKKVDLTAYVEKHEFCFDAVLDEQVSNDEVPCFIFQSFLRRRREGSTGHRTHFRKELLSLSACAKEGGSGIGFF